MNILIYANRYRPNIGKANRLSLESQYAGHQHNVIKQRTNRGVEKKDLVKTLREQRAKMVGPDADADVEAEEKKAE